MTKLNRLLIEIKEKIKQHLKKRVKEMQTLLTEGQQIYKNL